MFDNILLVLETHNNEFSYRQFQSAMKQTPCRDYPFLQKQLIPFAFSHSISELSKAATSGCEVHDDFVFVQDGGERIVRDSVCECSVFCVKMFTVLSCYYKYYCQVMSLISLTMFSPRGMHR